MSESESFNEDDDYIPPEILEAADKAIRNSLPCKSQAIYWKCYEELLVWMKGKNTKSFDEKVLLAYFDELTAKVVPPTLWSKYSMLRTIINVQKNIDISKYALLRSFIKQQNVGYKCRKAKVFSPAELDTFLKRAPDSKYLVTKVRASKYNAKRRSEMMDIHDLLCLQVVCVLGISGACRRSELHSLTINDVQREKNVFVLKLLDTKNNKPRTFVVEEKYVETVQRYIDLRPSSVDTQKFFINYQNGKCTKQTIGINKIGRMPREIAKWLGLSNPESYTGHSFRRTSTTLLADAGADILELKKHGGWKSGQVAEGYIEESINNKRKTAKKITNSIDEASSSNQAESTAAVPEKKIKINMHNDNATTSNDKSITISVPNCGVQ